MFFLFTPLIMAVIIPSTGQTTVWERPILRGNTLLKENSSETVAFLTVKQV